MSAATEKDIEALAAEMKQMRTDFSRLVEMLQSTAQHAGDDVLKQARETGEKLWGETKGKTEDLLNFVEARPVASAVTALGIGLLLGLLVGRRN